MQKRQCSDSILFEPIYLLGIVMVTWFLFRLSFIVHAVLLSNICVPSALLRPDFDYPGLYWPVIAMDVFVLAWVTAVAFRNRWRGAISYAQWLFPAVMTAFVIYNLSVLPMLVEWREVEKDPRAAYKLLWADEVSENKNRIPDVTPPGEMVSSSWASCTNIDEWRFAQSVVEERNRLESHFWESYSRRTSNGMEGALDIAEAIIARDSTNGEAWAMKALVYGNAVDYMAITPGVAGPMKRSALDKAIELAPQAPATHAAYGLLMKRKDVEGAERRLRQCIAAEPEFPACHDLYGDLLRKTNRPKQAGEIYLQGIERWPDDGELHVSYALYLQETRQAETAIDYLRQFVVDNPGFPRGHWHLAVMLYEEGGDLDEARAHAVKALEMDLKIWNGTLLLLELLKPDEYHARDGM